MEGGGVVVEVSIEGEGEVSSTAPHFQRFLTTFLCS